MSKELWIDIKGYEGYYQISSKCRVRSFKHNRLKIMKQTKDSGGYLMIGLSKNNTEKKYMVHNLFATYFLPNPLNYKHINHIDFNKTNNKLNNLEWCTHKINMEHAAKKPGRVWAKNWVGKFGSNHNTSKAVEQIDIKTNLVIKIFGSTMDAYRELGVQPAHISEVAIGKTNRVTAGGYKWRYIK